MDECLANDRWKNGQLAREITANERMKLRPINGRNYGQFMNVEKYNHFENQTSLNMI